MQRIAPLIQHQPGEVLVNLMTGHITRLIETTQPRRQFEELFGSTGFLDRVKGLSKLDRVDACVSEYCDAIRVHGSFEFICPAFVLRPERDRPHFNLIYATRNARGVEVFKRAEETAMAVMEQNRAQIEANRRFDPKQLNLIPMEQIAESTYYVDLRRRYLQQAKQMVMQSLATKLPVAYYELWKLSLTLPLVWERDLREWLFEWRRNGLVELMNLGRRTYPARDKNDFVLWK